MAWTAAQVRDALALPDDGAWAHYAQVGTDTRALVPGSLFVALVGERFDAHDYLAAARDAGIDLPYPIQTVRLEHHEPAAL